MSFFGLMGVGLAMNMLGGFFQPKTPMIDSSYLDLSKKLAQNSADMQKMWDKAADSKKITFDFDTPEFPDKSASRFENLQQQHEQERMTFLNDFKADREQAKEDYFSKNHYQTEKAPNGKEQVVLKDGKPVIESGKEGPAQREARLSFETTLKADLIARHGNEKNTFMQDNKQQLLSFLEANKFQLDNPAIQGEMAKFIVDGQKKALKLQRSHEEELFKVDLPTSDMQGMVSDKMDQFQELEQKQMQKEQNSPEARELANYQMDLVSMLDAKRAEARESAKEELFLKDLRKLVHNPPRKDLSTVLPMNIVIAIEQLGIDKVPG